MLSPKVLPDVYFIFKFLAIYNNGKLPKSRNKLPKYAQNFSIH